MSRSRNIKPGFYKNEDLAECSVWARFLFPGLWMMADREGRLEDRPKRIKGEIFPYDSVDVDQCLNELLKWGFIERYVADGKKVISVVNFLDHQTPHGKEQDSELPDKNGTYTVHCRNEKTGLITGEKQYVTKSTIQEPCKADSCNIQESGKNALIPGSWILDPDSRILDPDSRILDPDSRILDPDSAANAACAEPSQASAPPSTTKPKIAIFPSQDDETAKPHRAAADTEADDLPKRPGRKPSKRSGIDGRGTVEQPPSPTVIELPLNVNGTYHVVTQRDACEWESLYPAVDVGQQLRNMLGWLMANPEKRKTAGGIRKFINTWLAKEQDRGGSAMARASPIHAAPRSTKLTAVGQHNVAVSLAWMEKKQRELEQNAQ